MNAGMINYNKGPEFDGVTHTWDIVQKELHCCGVEACINILLGSFLKPDFEMLPIVLQSPADWTRERNETFPEGQVPNSCCVGGEV